MAKVTFSTDIQSISGKLCSKEGVVYSVNRRTGKTYRSDRHVYNDANTEAQQSVRASFAQKAKFAAAWWKQNRPSGSQPDGSEAYRAVMAAYKRQSKIGNSYAFLRSLVTDDCKVMLKGIDFTGGIASGGDTTEGGNPGQQRPGGSLEG